jgi:phthiodiolone/phenolphthiodiolone dimycocerosates ketoreductase
MGVTVETSVPAVVDRSFPPEAFARNLRTLEQSGVVDSIQMWDQMVGWIPRCLWSPSRSPMARVLPDLDSFADCFPMAGYAAAVAPSLASAISLDTLRRAPSELTQSMFTLANLTQGKSDFHLGTGELKQIQPYGHERKQKLGRLEDFYKIFTLFRDNHETPIDFEGRYTTLDQAWLGVARTHIPRIWGLGGGPKIIDLAAAYADGFATMGVMVLSDPEVTATWIKDIRDQVEAKGRDPEAFRFAAYFPCLLHEDDAVIDQMLDNDLSRYCATIWGRINQRDWEREGLSAPMGADWHYAEKLLPVRIDEPAAQEMISKSTRAHVEKSYLHGSPQKVASELQPFIDAGISWVGILDVSGRLLDPDDAARCVERQIETCRLIKANVAQSALHSTPAAA